MGLQEKYCDQTIDRDRSCFAEFEFGLSLSLAIAFEAKAAHLNFIFTNQQTQGSSHTGDMLVQHSDGTTELTPYMGIATGQYTMFVEYAGSPYTPSSSTELVFSGPGAGGGNSGGGGGGGGGDPIVIQGGPGGESNTQSSGYVFDGGYTGDGDSTIQVVPIGAWLWGMTATCMANRAIAAATAEYHCRNSGGVAAASYGMCGAFMSVSCRDNPPPRQPHGGGGSGGGTGTGTGGGGNGTAGVWHPVTYITPLGGTATVGPLRPY